MGLLQHPVLVGLRDSLFRLGPDAWFERAGADQYDYDPGELPDSV